MIVRREARGSLTVACAAKLNLHLEVLARRPDGFHEIETLFQEVSIFDECGHLPHSEKMAAFVAAVVKFDGKRKS